MSGFSYFVRMDNKVLLRQEVVFLDDHSTLSASCNVDTQSSEVIVLPRCVLCLVDDDRRHVLREAQFYIRAIFVAFDMLMLVHVTVNLRLYQEGVFFIVHVSVRCSTRFCCCDKEHGMLRHDQNLHWILHLLVFFCEFAH